MRGEKRRMKDKIKLVDIQDIGEDKGSQSISSFLTLGVAKEIRKEERRTR